MVKKFITGEYCERDPDPPQRRDGMTLWVEVVNEFERMIS